VTTDTAQNLELTCRQLVELITDYLEDALPHADRVRFDEHLTTCPYCMIYLDQMRQTVRALGSLPEPSLSTDAFETLLAHFRHWR
jgi:anti-sigma factor RsiW